LAALTACALLGFVIVGDSIAHNKALLYALLIVPIWGINAVIAVLSVYSAEIYPTQIRSKGTGLCAGACKGGGVLIIAFVTLGLAPPSITEIALIGALPLSFAVLALVFFGTETTRKPLEQIGGAEPMGAV
jgi:putative MFS transporter